VDFSLRLSLVRFITRGFPSVLVLVLSPVGFLLMFWMTLRIGLKSLVLNIVMVLHGV